MGKGKITKNELHDNLKIEIENKANQTDLDTISLSLNNTIDTHKADDTKHVVKNGTLQTGLNSEKINGKTATATPVTNEKIDLIGMVNEAFTNANNGKTSLANVIGSPTVASETFTQISTDVQNRKNDLATNLTAKGVSASNSESLKSLVDKVPTIAGVKFASGVATSGMTLKAYRILNDTVYNNYELIVNTLNFKPDIIIVKRGIGDQLEIVSYDTLGVETVPGIKWCRYNRTTGVYSNMENYLFKGNVAPAYINETGFDFPVFRQADTYNWYAIKLS